MVDKPETLKLEDLTPQERQAVLEEASRRFSKKLQFKNLEDLLTNPQGFNLTTATYLQRAICKALEGRPLGEYWKRSEVRRAFGGVEPKSKPREVVIISGIRTAKSLMAAAVAINATQTVDVSKLSSGEVPRFSILSLEKDNASVVLSHLLGALESPAFRHLRMKKGGDSPWKDLIDDTGADVVGSEFLWHPSGRPVEIRVVAGKRAGGSLVSRWSAGAVFDEAPRMVRHSDAVVNYDDAYRALRGRLLPEAQILSIGSPFQPFGPIYDIVTEEWGNPRPGRLVVKAPGPDMNPIWWNKERIAEVKACDQTVYRTDVLAEFADAEESLFPQEIIKRCLRETDAPIPYETHRDYAAAMDPATRGNSWTLVIASKIGRKKSVVWHGEWIGSTMEPLSPREVLKEIAAILKKYHLTWAYTDQWAADALKDIAREEQVELLIEDWTSKGKIDCFLGLRDNMADHSIELPNEPQIIKDLKLVRRTASTKGPSIQLPKTADGRHCDYASAIARVMSRWLEERQVGFVPGSEDWYKQKDIEDGEADAERFSKQGTKHFGEEDPWQTSEQNPQRNNIGLIGMKFSDDE